jgi:hypothetical protein
MKQPTFTLRNSLIILKKYKREGGNQDGDSNQQDEGSPKSQYSQPNNNFKLNIGEGGNE